MGVLRVWNLKLVCQLQNSSGYGTGPVFMDGVQLPQGCRATTRRHSTFTTKLPSILSFPKKFLPTIFQFSRIDSKF